jgi:hypothetical protein
VYDKTQRKIPSVADQIRNNKDDCTERIDQMEAEKYQKFSLHYHPTPRRDTGRPRKDRNKAVTGHKAWALRVRKRIRLYHIIISASCTMGTGSFPGVKSGRDETLTLTNSNSCTYYPKNCDIVLCAIFMAHLRKKNNFLFILQLWMYHTPLTWHEQENLGQKAHFEAFPRIL